MSSTSSQSAIEIELLVDRLLSVSTPSECLDALERLQGQVRRHADWSKSSFNSNNVDDEGPNLDVERQTIAIDSILANKSVLRALCSLIAHCTLPYSIDRHTNDTNNLAGSSGMEVEGADIAACELLLEILSSTGAPNSNDSFFATEKEKSGPTTASLHRQQQIKRRMEFISKTLLHFHEVDERDILQTSFASCALIPSLLDCLCSSNSKTTVYARVLSLQILQSLLMATPGALREQLMKAPDGINRLVDLLGHDSSSSSVNAGGNEGVPEEVRNQAILFLTQLSSSSSVLARLITFSEGYDRALKIALESGGGKLTGGSAVAKDCLELCLSLALADDVARELFLGGGDGRGNLDRLAMLIDLRGGERFKSEERNFWWSEEIRKVQKLKIKGDELDFKSENDTKTSNVEKSSKDKGGKRAKQPKDDELDEILRGADTISNKVKSEDAAFNPSSQPQHTSLSSGYLIPYLTPNETVIFDSICNLLLILLYDGDYLSGITQPPRSSSDASFSKRRARAKTIIFHDLLTRSIVDCALYTLPPPGVEYISAVPPPKLQEKALITMAVLGSLGDTVSGFKGETERNSGITSDTEIARWRKEEEEVLKIQDKLLFQTMPLYLHGNVTAMERLMYLACTGAYFPQNGNFDDDISPEAVSSLLSLNALSAFRSCLPSEVASRMVLHALAPPPPDEEADTEGDPFAVPVVTKLITTLTENLKFLQSQQHLYQKKGDEDSSSAELDLTDVYRATIAASGAAIALGVFLTKGEGDATREMLLRMPLSPLIEFDEVGNREVSTSEATTNTSLIDFILQFIAMYDPNMILPFDACAKSPSVIFYTSTSYVNLMLLRLLAEWIDGMPKAVLEVLSSPSSVSLGILVRAKERISGEIGARPAVARAASAMSGLLLGLCLENLHEKKTEELSGELLSYMENSAWTKETIIDMIQSIGVGKYLNMIDEWKSRTLPLPFCSSELGPAIERRMNTTWYNRSVTLVRRCIVMTMASDKGNIDSDSDVENEGGNTEHKVSVRSLRKMVTNQAKEMDELLRKLEEASKTIDRQSVQIKGLKRVAELGTSSETNDMLSEYAEKVLQLENEKNDVIIEAEKQSNLRNAELTAKDMEITSIKEELRNAQLVIEESEREKESLTEEMTGLSAAYNLLEEEYRSRSLAHSMLGCELSRPENGTAAVDDRAAPAFESDVSSEQQERRNQNNISELQLIQDENTRLREDVRAANEWMAMAVSKMEEMEGTIESLTRSLEDARNPPECTQSGSSVNAELDTLRNEIHRITSSAEADLRAKDDELAQQRFLILELEGRMDQITHSPLRDGLHLVDTDTLGELESLRQSNKEAQEWMASAVKHVEMLTDEVVELKSRNEDLERTSHTKLSQVSMVLETKVSELEAALLDVYSERDKLKASLTQAKEEIESLHTEAREVAQTELNEVRAQNDLLTSECDTLNSKIAEFQSWSETAQSRVIEIETALEEVTLERNELRSILEQRSTADLNLQLDTLQTEMGLKNDEINSVQLQLEQLKLQRIEDTDIKKGEIECLRADLEFQQQLSNEMKRKEEDSIKELSRLASDNEKMIISLSEKQNEINSMKSTEIHLTNLIKESNRSIADLEAANVAAEERVNQLLKIEDSKSKSLEDDLIAITAERNAIKSHLEDLTDMYDQTKKSLECLQVENGNLAMKNRALEQDIKNLDIQVTSASREIQRITQLKERMTELEALLVQSNETKNTIQSALDDLRMNSESVVMKWQERVEELESNLSLLETQMNDQEKEALDAIEQWEERCSTLEESVEDITRQWGEQVESINSDIAQRDHQVALLSEKNKELEERLADNCQQVQNQKLEKEEAIASYDEQIKMLTKELILTREESELVVKQWQVRSEQLNVEINELNEAMSHQQSEANDAITQWETRCSVLSEKIEELEIQLENQNSGVIVSLEQSLKSAENALVEKESNLMTIMSELTSMQASDKQKEIQISTLVSQLETEQSKLKRSAAEHELLCQTLLHKENEHLQQIKVLSDEKDNAYTALQYEKYLLNSKLEKTEKDLEEARAESVHKEKEWVLEKTSFNMKIMELETKGLSSSERTVALQNEYEQLKNDITVLEQEKSILRTEKENAIKENDESRIILYEIQEELRHAKEELQAFSTDQFSVKAVEMATQALRQQVLEIRSQYAADQKELSKEREARMMAEDTIGKLKANLALVSQAVEYDESVDIHVKRIAKQISAENLRKERQEMEELRSALESLREEIGSCRFREREADEKAANARLQKSILEQEVKAAKTDLALLEQALEEVETSKIDLCVSLEYRIETLLHEQAMLDKSHKDEIASIRAQLANIVQEKDGLMHRLEQSEKANTALSLNIISENESESEIVKLQLERAQLLAKFAEVGVDSERRIREAVAAHASSAEVELIIEKQLRKSVESSLSDALSELKQTKAQLQLGPSVAGDSDRDHDIHELSESLIKLQKANEELQHAKNSLEENLCKVEKDNKTVINNLTQMLRTAEKRLRENEREIRFETALSYEIAHLRNGNPLLNAQCLLPKAIFEETKESVDQNVLALYDYVIELKSSINEERLMYKELLCEHEDLLALLGQASHESGTLEISG